MVWGCSLPWQSRTWAQAVAAIVLLDLAIYFQHVLFHAVPVLWRLHRLHHADTDFDVTTGTRFHPIEIVIVHGHQVRAWWPRSARRQSRCWCSRSC